MAAALARLRSLTAEAGGYISSETVDHGGTGPSDARSAAEDGTADSDAVASSDGSHAVVKVPSDGFERTWTASPAWARCCGSTVTRRM